MPAHRIFIYPVVTKNDRDRIRAGLPGAEIFFFQDYLEHEAREIFLSCDILFGNPPLDWVEASENLEWVQLESAGLDPFQLVIGQGRIQFSNLKDFFSQPVAETAVAGILALYRNIHLLMQAQQEKHWAKDEIRQACETVKEKNILILGPGSIGQMIARFLTPMGGNIRMFGSRKELSGSPGRLDELLPVTDILIGSLPESATTIRLLNEKRLKLLPSRAIVVNVGRGSLIDEAVLIRLLKENKLKGAFLDVTEQEPVPPESELWEVPNLLLGQHAAGGMPEELAGKVNFFIKNYAAYVKGSPANLVDRAG